MGVFDFKDADQLGLCEILAAVLHIGNLTFETLAIKDQDDGSTVSADAKSSLQATSHLLGLTAEALDACETRQSTREGKFGEKELEHDFNDL